MTTRLMLSALAAIGVSALTPSPVAARDYPICLNYVAGRMGAVERCEYTTIEQCRFAALGLQGSCALNWRYAPSPAERRRKRDAAGY